MKNFLLKYKSLDGGSSFGLMIFRLAMGGMMLTHGIPKLLNFSENMQSFRNPIGLGPEISYLGAVFGEVVCAVAIILGLYTRLASIGLGFVMFVAGFIVHADDPFSRQEKSLLFLTACILLFFTGPGKYSLDSKVLR